MSETAPETTAASAPLPYELVGAPIEVNRFDPTVQRVVTGYEVQAKWLNNGTVVTVFVPEDQPLAATVDTLVREKGAQLDALHAIAG